LVFRTPNGERVLEARVTVLALGGASWSRFGSDGAWVQTLAAKDIAVLSLKPANCGFVVAWSKVFRERVEGQPLKGVALSFESQIVRGEAIVTSTGLEGGAIYALSADDWEAPTGGYLFAGLFCRRSCGQGSIEVAGAGGLRKLTTIRHRVGNMRVSLRG
jgi:predicted flavoprotein YhiN